MQLRFVVSKLGPGLVLAVVLSMLGSCSLISDRRTKDSLPIEIDLSQEGHAFMGMGANVPISFYNRRTRPLQVLNDLRISHIRVKRTGDNWNDIAALRAATYRLKIKWIYSLDKIPLAYLDESGRLMDVDGFAHWWAEEVDELNYQEVPADFIELIESPDLANAGAPIMNADDYNQLIHTTRQELDLREYQDVAMIGPGLSSLSTSDSMETWYMDLDQQAFETLRDWSVELHDDASGAMSMGGKLQDFQAYLEKIESIKPILLTSYTNRIKQYGEFEYPDPERYDILGNKPDYERYYYSASFSMPYALRSYSNTLDLLSHPQVIPFIHQLFDAPEAVKFKKQSWGLLDLNGGEKPLYTLLSALLSRIPKQARILTLDLSDTPGLRGLGFLNNEKLVLTLCNETATRIDVRFIMKAAPDVFTIVHAMDLLSPKINHPDLGRMDIVEEESLSLKLKRSGDDLSTSFPATLRPNSIFIAELERQ